MTIKSIEKESVTYYSFDDICSYCEVRHDVREWSKIKNKNFSYTDEDKKRYISKKGIYQFLLLGFNIDGYEKIFEYFNQLEDKDSKVVDTKSKEQRIEELEQRLSRINEDIALILQ